MPSEKHAASKETGLCGHRNAGICYNAGVERERVVLKETEPAKRQSGRPRSEAARQATLSAAIKLLDTHSVRDISIEAIAREAGVGKVTIYRWWPNKIRLIIDAFMELMTPRTSMPKPGAQLSDMTKHFQAVVREYQGKFGRIVAQIVAEGQFDRDTFEYFLEAMISKRREFAANVINQAKASGEVRNDLDTDILIDLLYGPIYFRLLVGHKPLNAAFSRELTQFVTELATAGPKAGRPRKRSAGAVRTSRIHGAIKR